VPPPPGVIANTWWSNVPIATPTARICKTTKLVKPFLVFLMEKDYPLKISGLSPKHEHPNKTPEDGTEPIFLTFYILV
jgi:hypothetical protein